MKIFVDSQAAIKALDSVEMSSKLVLDTKTELNILSKKGSITLVWTKAHHVGIEGNEEADKLAKEGRADSGGRAC